MRIFLRFYVYINRNEIGWKIFIFSEAPQHSLTDTSSLNARRRCVQFSAIQNNENVSLEIPAEDDGGERGEEESEPRVQIVGAQEVYMNDPREVNN